MGVTRERERGERAGVCVYVCERKRERKWEGSWERIKKRVAGCKMWWAEEGRPVVFLYPLWVCHWRHTDGCCVGRRMVRWGGAVGGFFFKVVGELKENKGFDEGFVGRSSLDLEFGLKSRGLKNGWE